MRIKIQSIILVVLLLSATTAMSAQIGQIPFIENLRLSNSKSMNVNGSSAQKTFSAGPDVLNIYAVTSIGLLLKDEGTTGFGSFGALSALTNGIKIRANIYSTDQIITTVKDNSDLVTRFGFSPFTSSAVLSILGITTPVGFGNSNNAFSGNMILSEPLILNGSNSENLNAVIQDNLTNIDLLEMSIRGYMAGTP